MASQITENPGVAFNKTGDYTISVSPNTAYELEAEENGTPLTTSNYKINDEATVTLTVEDIGADSYLEVRKNTAYGDKLYYSDLADMSDAVSADALKDYVSVYLNGERLVNAADYHLYVASSNEVPFGSLNALDGKYKKAGATFYVSANSTVLGIGSVPGSVMELEVKKQPIVISANAANDGSDVTGLYQLAGAEPKTKYSGSIKVFRETKDGKLGKDITETKTSLTSWTTSENATVDLAGIDTTRAGKYSVKLTGIELISANNINTNYVLSDAYGEYNILASLIVSIRDLQTGSALSANKAIKYGTDYVEFVSTNKAEKLNSVEWYIKDTDDDGEYLDDYWDRDIINDGYGVRFNGLESLSGNLVLYARFSSDSKAAESSKDSNFVVSPIEPVVYNGNKFVAWNDTAMYDKKTSIIKKGYTARFGVDVWYGNKNLTCGTDYKLSYKNNTNAADAGIGKKAPTVIVTGLGDYKGLKVEQTFTILPADFKEIAKVSLTNEFIKYSGKAMSKIFKGNAVYTVGSKKNKKLGKSGYTFKMYDSKGNDVTNTSFAKTAAYGEYTVKAIATGKDANYAGETEEVTFYGIPSNSKAIKVKGVIAKANYATAGKVYTDFIDKAKFEATVDKNTKIKTLSDQRIDVSLVAEKSYTATKIDKLEHAGTYFIRVKPVSANTFASSGVFEPGYVKVTYKGAKVKGMVGLTTRKFTWNNAVHDLELKISNKVENAGDILIYQTEVKNKDTGRTEDDSVGKLSEFTSGKIPGAKLNNKKAGTYTLKIKGTKSCEGEYTLTYTVDAPKYNKKMVQAYINTDSNKKEDIAVSFNKAGYPSSIVNVWWTDPTNSAATPIHLTAGTDYTITWGKNETAGKGKVTITGKNTYFSGSFTKDFTINKSDISKVAKYVRANSSALLSSNKANAYITQELQDNGKTKYGVLVQGKDFKVINIKENATSKTATADIDASSSKSYYGTIKNITYDLYPTEVTKVVLTLDKMAVSVNSVYDGTPATDAFGNEYMDNFVNGNVQIAKAEIYLKGQKNPTTLTKSTDIASTFDVGFINAGNVGSKAQVMVMFKGSNSSIAKKYPTNKVYYSGNYTIYVPKD